MKDFKDFAKFLDYVKANKVYETKLELSSMVVLLKGDYQKIYDAIAFAKDNSDFNFDSHLSSKPNIPLNTEEDKFVYEKGQLVSNFSEERLNEVIRLYPLMCKEKGFIHLPDHEETSGIVDERTIKNIAIVGGVVIGAYLLYQLLK